MTLSSRSALARRTAPAILLPLLGIGGHAAADMLEGTVLAFDRVAGVIVMNDKSVIPLDKLSSELPSDLAAGDRIEVDYESNEDDGIHVVHSVTRLD